MTIVAGRPCSCAASAIAWAWLPDDAATTPSTVAELGDRVVGAAELERAGALQVLGLQDRAAERDRRGQLGHALQPRGRRPGRPRA